MRAPRVKSAAPAVSIRTAPDGAAQPGNVVGFAERLAVDVSAELLELALTHRSFAFENGGVPHNERLEFLGDSVLGQAVTVMLYTTFPDLSEGELAKRRASLVSTVALAEIARGIGLGAEVRLGRGEEMTGGRDKPSILADTLEAVIGATYLSAGAEQAREFVLRLIRPLTDDPARYGVSIDPKTTLQELAVRLGRGIPTYSMTDTGPAHAKSFEATVALGEEEPLASGQGPSKKQAEMAAARAALALLPAP